MAITVYGAGAIGGTTGAALARAGHDVLLVDSAAPHVEAINAHGITIERKDGAITTRVPAVTPDELGHDLALVLLAVKSHHTADVLRDLAPRLAPDGTIVSLQNGLSEEQIAAVVSAVEETPVTDNIWGYKWAKLIYGALLFATAVVDAHVYEVVERSPGVKDALVSIVGEGIAVADKAGVRVLAFDEFDPAWYRAALAGDVAARDHAMAAIAAHYRQHTKTKTGIWRDLAVRKRKTEVDGQLGMLARKGEAFGVAMPLTRRLAELIRDLEDGRRQMDWSNLDPLVTLAEKETRS